MEAVRSGCSIETDFEINLLVIRLVCINGKVIKALINGIKEISYFNCTHGVQLSQRIVVAVFVGGYKWHNLP